MSGARRGGMPPKGTMPHASNVEAVFTNCEEYGLKGSQYYLGHTDVKNIKKPNGAKPGFVVYYTYYSVNVRPKKPDGGK